MKQWWLTQSARIDAMSLRERAFLFLSVILVALALVDVLWLSPAQTAHRLTTQRHAAQGVELTRLRAELAQVARPVDANQVNRQELATADAQLQQVMQEIKALAPVMNGGPPLEQVLVQFLRRQNGLTLVGTTSLAPEAAPASATPAAAATAAVPGLSKRGLELRVSGPYAELTRYVKTLESALPSLRWGPLVLQKEKDQRDAELMLQVFVVGVQP